MKTIVNTRVVVPTLIDHPHNFFYKEGFKAVDADFSPVVSYNTKRGGGTSKIVIHHYVTKSKQDFQEKIDRGVVMGIATKRW